MTNIFVTRIAKNGDTKLNIRALNFLALQGEFDSSVVEGRLPVRNLAVLISGILININHDIKFKICPHYL